MTEIVPAIIPESFEDLKKKIEIVSPFVNNVQIDIMDGKYTPSTSWPFSDNIAGLPKELQVNVAQQFRVGMELDMMVEHGEKYFDEWIEFGIQTFIIHFESTDKLEEIIKTLRTNGKGVAIALKPSTSIENLEPYVEKVDFIQFMGNDRIGYHGVQLHESVLKNIQDLRSRHKKLIIGVDIGVNFETAPRLVKAGVTKLVSGSAIYESSDIGDAIRRLSMS